jgi:ammonium transporter, Amt family
MSVSIVPGDTAWILVSAALVMFMTPGLALFYGGLVRSKHVLGTIAQSFVALAVVAVIWVLVGYTLAFGPDLGGVVGGLAHAGFAGIGAEPESWAPTVPGSAFATFQLMFAIITPALITGAVAERMRFGAYLLFLAAWSVLVYAPLAHWVWGGGFLGADGIGALDFAGGTVVHVNAGAAALAAIVYVGRRKDYPRGAFVPHNVPMVILGAAILWFGWFGFNAGSAVAAGGIAAGSFLATHLAAATAMLAWLGLEWTRHRHATTIGAATGAVAGLVAITPAAGYVTPMAALVIGAVAGAVCFGAVELKHRLGYDDSLDVVGVHLAGGVAGALLTGIFASAAVNAAGVDGSVTQLLRQAAAVGVSGGFSFGATLAILALIDRVIRVRASEAEEDLGLDATLHGETAYSFGERTGLWRASTDGLDPDDELRRLSERIVAEATRRTIEALRAPSPLD